MEVQNTSEASHNDITPHIIYLFFIQLYLHSDNIQTFPNASEKNYGLHGVRCVYGRHCTFFSKPQYKYMIELSVELTTISTSAVYIYAMSDCCTIWKKPSVPLSLSVMNYVIFVEQS